MLAIQKSDSYQTTVDAFKDPAHGKVIIFPNRGATEQCIFRFQFQKVSNGLRQLPLDQRVDKIVDGIEHPPEEFQFGTYSFDTYHSFEGELVPGR